MIELTHRIKQEEMVGVFLAAELYSGRFGHKINSFLKNHRLRRAIITSPNFDCRRENAIRAKALGASRGYGQNRALFKAFPKGVTWYRGYTTAAELREFYYVKTETTLQATQGSRKFGHVRLSVFDRREPNFSPSVEVIKKRLRKGQRLQPLIAIATSRKARKLVVLEGNARATAITALGPDVSNVELIIGLSPDFVRFPFW